MRRHVRRRIAENAFVRWARQHPHLQRYALESGHVVPTERPTAMRMRFEIRNGIAEYHTDGKTHWSRMSIEEANWIHYRTGFPLIPQRA